MSSLYYLPWKNIPWKSSTYPQLTTTLQKNQNTGKNYFEAGPIKLYRREIATGTKPCSRPSSSIDELNQPNGYLITNKGQDHSLVNTISLDIPVSQQNCCSVNDQANNARRRCRSSGNMNKKFDARRNDYSYFTNSNQYLVSRSKTFLQNQYRHVRKPDVSLVTSPLLEKPTYSPNGISHCPKTYYNGQTSPFSYVWVDGLTYLVTIPEGYYDVHDLNGALESALIARRHYYVNGITNSYVFMLQIVYNVLESAVELQVFSTTNVPSPQFAKPLIATWTATKQNPQFVIDNNAFQNLVGFSAGTYPSANTLTNNQGILSNMAHSIAPSYSVVHYKPNNSRFAQQGATSSSDLIARLKYEAITNTAESFAAPLGKQVANAMAYGVSDSVYTLKAKLGYPGKRTPILPKYGPPTCEEYTKSCVLTSGN